VTNNGACESFLNNNFEEGESPVCYVHVVVHGALFLESRSLGLERKTGGRFHLQLNMCLAPIANKCHQGNMKKSLTRGLKVFENAGKEANETYLPWQECSMLACL